MNKKHSEMYFRAVANILFTCFNSFHELAWDFKEGTIPYPSMQVEPF